MTGIEEIFGKVVRKRRTQLGYSQEEFAAKAGIHRTYASSIELGKVTISIAIAQQLADALETPLSKLWKSVEKEQDAT